jgi:spermidine synthase
VSASATGASNVQYLASGESVLGMIYLRQRELLSQPGTLVVELLLDHALLMSSCSAHSEQALAREAISMRAGRQLRVLVGGLGLGYTARAVLASPDVAALDVIEFLPQVIGWFESGLIPLGREIRADSRFSLREGDVYAYLARDPVDRYDLILIDVDHAPEEHLGDANSTFYTEAALYKAGAHLAADGILGIWSYAESRSFAQLLSQVFGEVRVERVTFWNPVIEQEESNWLFLARQGAAGRTRDGAGETGLPEDR